MIPTAMQPVVGTLRRNEFVGSACGHKRHVTLRCSRRVVSHSGLPFLRFDNLILPRLTSHRHLPRPRRGVCLQKCIASQQAEVTVLQTSDERLVLLERLQRNTLETGTKDGLNVVAFGGGVASTLAAYLAHAVFEGKSVAVFVRLPGTTDEDVVRVSYLASFIGIDLWQLPAVSQPLESQFGDKVDEDVPSGALPAALAAIRGMLEASGGPPAVVFDGLYAKDLPNFSSQQEEVSASWEGSEDCGEAAAASYASVAEAADRDVDLSQTTALPGLPAPRRVSLLAGLPEIAVRAVADLAGMPNWDWVKPEAAPVDEPSSSSTIHQTSFYDGALTASASNGPVAEQHMLQREGQQPMRDGDLASKARDAVKEVLHLESSDQIQIQVGQAAEAVVHIEPAALPSPNRNIASQLRERLHCLGLRPVVLQPSSLS